MDTALAMDGEEERRQPGVRITWLHVAAFVAVGIGALTLHADHWAAWPLLVITVFTIVSDLTWVETGSRRMKVSGSFLGIVLAAVLLGPGVAALVGTLSIGVGWLRSREAPHYLRNNLATYACFPFFSGLFFHTAIQVGHIGSQADAYYLLVFATFALALAVNFFCVAGYQCYLDRSSLVQKAREALVPLLSAELFSAVLTMAAVYVAVRLGSTGLALFAIVLVIFQYLVGELLTSKHRGEELHRMATTDDLTGLANRERFREHLEEQIAAAGSAQSAFAVMLLDLDRFKEVNDTLGHHYGDELLRELGPRLADCVGPDGLVARLGGDEFAVLPGGRAEVPDELEAVAARLIACVQQPVVIDEMTLEVGASVGISRFPVDGDDPHSLLRRADVAMYAAKEVQCGSKVYAPDLDRNSVRRLSVLSDFRRALEAEEIVLYYQPVVEVNGTDVRGAEALIRWQHPDLGLLAPGTFIPTVEQSGLIGPLTRYVLERAIAKCASWRQAGNDLWVAVNLSVRNLLDRGLPADIERMLSTYGLPAHALRIEITESMLMSDPERALETLTTLSELGARISVDDFGTGYSSLVNLRRLPIDELKIDRSFVSPMLTDESDLIIVRSTINLGHDLGLRVIAEGVEDDATLERLARLGCDLIQGYHISRPLAADAFDVWLGDMPPLEPALALAG